MPYDTNFDAVLTASDDEYVLYSAEDDKTYKSAAVLSAAESDSSEVLYSAKYSLQGTTQGRYLTGGVPPVRFSM